MVLIGIALRLPGFLFNGTHDVEEMIFGWGTTLVHSGFSEAQSGNWDYGVFSYPFHAIAAAMAYLVPRFWWLPHKVMGLGFEVGILVLLLRLAAPEVQRLVVALYWLNPCFILQGAWLGYWDAPFVMAGLAAVVLVRELRPGLRWQAVGATLAVAANLKPQGVAFFFVPAVAYLTLRALLRSDWRPLLGFTLGALVTCMIAALVLVIGGADSFNPTTYLLNAAVSMPNLSNGGLNIWRPVVAAYQFAHGQTGPTYAAQLEPVLDVALNVTAWALTGLLLFGVTLRAARLRQPDESTVNYDPAHLLAVLSYSALSFSAFAPRSHLGHGYAALTLLVLCASNRTRLIALSSMAAIQFYGLIATYGVGQERLPHPSAYGEAAQTLIAAVQGAAHVAPSLVSIQATVNNALEVLPFEPALSVLSAVQWILAIFLLSSYFGLWPPRGLVRP